MVALTIITILENLIYASKCTKCLCVKWHMLFHCPLYCYWQMKRGDPDSMGSGCHEDKGQPISLEKKSSFSSPTSWPQTNVLFFCQQGVRSICYKMFSLHVQYHPSRWIPMVWMSLAQLLIRVGYAFFFSFSFISNSPGANCILDMSFSSEALILLIWWFYDRDWKNLCQTKVPWSD